MLQTAVFIASSRHIAQTAIRENIERDIERERRKADNPDAMEDDADEVRNMGALMLSW